jgi:hypothetical protein
MIPTIGRIVHYTSLGDKDGKYPPEQQAAIVTKVLAIASVPETREEDRFSVSLKIFYPTGFFDMQGVPFSSEYARGHWSWPPQVQA